MRAGIVAKKDFRDAIQSRSLWGVTAFLVVFTAGLAYSLNHFRLFSFFWPFFLVFFSEGEAATLEFVHFYLGPAQFLIPLVALVITYQSIAGEIESGSVKFLLSVPLTRWDALAGKLMGRGAVLTTALVVGLTAAGVLVRVLTGDIDLSAYAVLFGCTILFGLAYVSIGVTISALADTQSRAVVYVVGVYMFLVGVWNFANNVILYVREGTFFPPLVGTSGPPDMGGWWYLVDRLTPGGAFNGIVTEMLLDEPAFHQAFPDGIPWYLESGPLVLILLAWIVLPIVVGYLRFNRADIS